jgi:hypothetical protein
MEDNRMSKLFDILDNNGWTWEKYTSEAVGEAVDQWKIKHADTNEVARLWEVNTPESDQTRYIVFWGYAKKQVTEKYPSGKEKTVEWKLLMDYAYTADELDSALKVTLGLIYPERAPGLEKAALMPGFDMLGGE